MIIIISHCSRWYPETWLPSPSSESKPQRTWSTECPKYSGNTWGLGGEKGWHAMSLFGKKRKPRGGFGFYQLVKLGKNRIWSEERKLALEALLLLYTKPFYWLYRHIIYPISRPGFLTLNLWVPVFPRQSPTWKQPRKQVAWWLTTTPLKNDGVRHLGWWHSQYMEKTNSCSKPPISKFRNFRCDYEPINHITSWHNWRFISFISNNHRLRGWYHSTPEVRDGLSKGRQL